jgi:hypothetical protein
VPRRRTFSATLPSFGQSISASCANDASSNPFVTAPVKSIVPGMLTVQPAKPVQANGSDAGPATENVTAPSARTTPVVTRPLTGAQLAPCVKEPVKLEPVCWSTSVPVQLLNEKARPAGENLIVQSKTCCGGDELVSSVGPAYVPPTCGRVGVDGPDGLGVRLPQAETSDATRKTSAVLVGLLENISDSSYDVPMGSDCIGQHTGPM